MKTSENVSQDIGFLFYQPQVSINEKKKLINENYN